MQRVNIGTTHVFPCINIYWVLRKLCEYQAARLSVQQLLRDLAGKC